MNIMVSISSSSAANIAGAVQLSKKIEKEQSLLFCSIILHKYGDVIKKLFTMINIGINSVSALLN